ncbi:MAG TPA: LysR substrate-binding domain-containing protein [Polyangiales bacterium]|nr:LysR substrate-binding domain-containing protein [Polyangiales bacterium]
MDRLDDLEAFLAIVERGSQTAAAKGLRRSLQAIGRSLTALERSVGVELVRRTTRRSQPTEAGLALYHRLKPALLEIQEAKREAANKRSQPFGTLRIAAPVRFSAAFVVPTIREFVQRYPGIELDLRTSDRRVDLYEEKIDVAVRIRHLPDSGLRARRLGALRVVVFGAKSYLERYGRPREPNQLVRHQCIVRRTDPEGEKWLFRVRGKDVSIPVRGRFSTDDTNSVQEATALGLGLGRAPAWQIRPLLEQGKVDIVLEEFEAAKLPISAVSPATKLPLPQTKVFIDLLAARLKHEVL